MKWIILAVVGVAGIIGLLAFSGFADVPCQDGVWDDIKQTCIPI